MSGLTGKRPPMVAGLLLLLVRVACTLAGACTHTYTLCKRHSGDRKNSLVWKVSSQAKCQIPAQHITTATNGAL